MAAGFRTSTGIFDPKNKKKMPHFTVSSVCIISILFSGLVTRAVARPFQSVSLTPLRRNVFLIFLE